VQVIEIHGLFKSFKLPFRGQRGEVQALAGVSLSLPEGSAFGLIGLNGAGKTTLIKILLGIATPTTGSVKLLGSAPSDPHARAKVGYLPERLELPRAWRAVDFLLSCARLKKLPNPRDEANLQLRRVGLESAAQRKVGAFSKGMRQRLGLAAALLGSPALLVLDEPTDGIDPLGRIEVRKILEEERARGASLFLNSHLLSETERICDRIGILSKGQLVREGALSSLSGDGRHYRLGLRGELSQDLRNELSLEEVGNSAEGRYRVEVEHEDALNHIIDRIRAANILLLSLARERDDLEAILSHTMETLGTQPPSQDGGTQPEGALASGSSERA